MFPFSTLRQYMVCCLQAQSAVRKFNINFLFSIKQDNIYRNSFEFPLYSL